MPSVNQIVAAIIPAAGSGARMNGGMLKPLLEVCGKRIIEWTLEAVTGSNKIQEILIMVPKEHFNEFEFLKINYPNINILEGGATRQDSVRRGVSFLENRIKPEDLILIHDAARCLVTNDIVTRAIEAAKHYSAVTVAVPMVDTVKEVDEQQLVVRTLNREKLWSIQTPQVFKAELLFQAHREVESTVTDDASLVERLHKVRIVKGERENIKITTPLDLEIAHLLLRKRQKFIGISSPS